MNIVGYLAAWTMDNFPDAINTVKFNQLTHLIFEGVDVTSSTNPKLKYGSWGWSGITTYFTQCATAAHAAGKKCLVCLNNSGGMPALVANATLRTQLVANLLNFCNSYGGDGVEIDVEDMSFYKSGGCDILAKDLYAALHPSGKLVTLSGAWDKMNVSLATQSSLDFIDVMCYDMTYSPATSVLPVHASLDDSVAGMNIWIKAGFDKSKLVMGIPCYGKNKSGQYVLYREIIDALNPASNVNQTSQSVTARGTTFAPPIWWNGIDLVNQKVQWAKDNGLGGIMLFDVGEDKPGDSRSLLQTVYANINVTPTPTPVPNPTSTSAPTTSFVILNGVSYTLQAGQTATITTTNPVLVPATMTYTAPVLNQATITVAPPKIVIP